MSDDATAAPAEERGSSAKRLGASLLGLLQGHVELFGIELQEQKADSLRLLLLGGLTLICALLLLRGYLASRTTLLFWSSLCFAGLAANNVLLFVDLAVINEVDLSLFRSLVGLGALMLLLFGLVWESK